MNLDWPAAPTAPTCGVIGWPVTYSLSPDIHRAAYEAMGMDRRYVHLPVQPDALPSAFERLAADGYEGANVTIPHKTEAAELCAWLSEDADILNAVNTLAPLGEGGFAGHNTDAPGFSRFLVQDAGWDAAGRSALVFGVGGAARACVLALARMGLDRLTLAARDADKASRVVRLANDLGVDASQVPFAEAVASPADLLVNATPLGRAGESLPLPTLGREVVVVDLLYDPPMTPMLVAAAEAGARTFGGLGLLVHQAALSFELWTGRTAPLEIMRQAAARRLEQA